jgi:tetratricopeptide (TPR) repeat protein
MADLALRLLLAVIALTGLLQIPAAHAQTSPSEKADANVKAAKSYVDAGLTAQSIGDYDTAITLYTKAYELVQHPILLFNIAQVYRLAERDDKAAKYYRQFLGTTPVGPEAQLARELLAEIEEAEIEMRQLAEERAAEEARVEDAGAKKRKRKQRGSNEGDEDDERNDGEARAGSPWSLPSARVDIGFAYRRRTLGYTVVPSVPKPPSLDSDVYAIRLGAQIYPFSFSERRTLLAGLGVFARLERSFALSISASDVPLTPAREGNYAIGACYRGEFGRSALWASLGYARRYQILDRSLVFSLLPEDAMDVDYASVSPAIGGRIEAATWLSVFTELEAMLVVEAGPIAQADSFGAGHAFGFGANAGADISFSGQFGARFSVELNQVDLRFDQPDLLITGISATTDSEFAIAMAFTASF